MLCFILKLLDVRQVLAAAGGFFVTHEQGLGDEVHGEVVECGRHFARPGFGELDGVDGGDDVDAVWGDAELHDRIGLGEIGCRDVDAGEPEFAKGAFDSDCVVVRRLDEDVDVGGETGPSVKGDGVSTDDQVSNAVGV